MSEHDDELQLTALLTRTADSITPSADLWDLIAGELPVSVAALDRGLDVVTDVNGHESVSSAGADSSLASLPTYPPADEPTAAVHAGRRRWPVLAVAAAVIALAGGAVVVNQSRHHPTVKTSASDSGTLPRFLVVDPPAGLRLRQATIDQTVDVANMPDNYDVSYRTTDGSSWFAVSAFGRQEFLGQGGDAASVNGHPAVVQPDGVRWVVDGAGYTLSAARGTFDRAGLLDIAAGVQLVAGGSPLQFDVTNPPAGYQLVQRGTLADQQPTRSYSMQYSSFNPDAASDNDLQVVVGVGSPALLDAGTGAKRSVSLRGHDGVALDASYANGDFLTLGWEERPHIYVVLHAQGLTADQLLTVAKAMKPVSLSEWTQAMGSVLQGADSAAGAATTAAATTEAVAVPASVPPGSSDGGVTPASIAPPSGPSFPDMAKLTQNPPPVVASGQLEGRPWALHAGTVPLTQQDNTNVTVPGKFTACAVLDFAKRPAMIVQCDTPDSGSVGTGVIRSWNITDSPRRFVLLLVDPKVATADATFDTGHVVTAAATTIDRAGPTDSKALVIPILPTDRLNKVVFKDGAGTVIETLTVDVPGDPEQR